MILLSLTTFSLSFSAMGLLCFSSKRNFKSLDITLLKPHRTLVRAIAYAILIAVFFMVTVFPPNGITLVEWMGSISIAGIMITLTQTYRSHWLPFLSLGTLIPGLALSVFVSL